LSASAELLVEHYAAVVYLYDADIRQYNVFEVPSYPGITQCTTLKILGVTITNGLSMAEHIHGVRNIIMFTNPPCTQRLRVLRAHGMPASAIHEVFRAVVIAKLSLYAMHPVLNNWWGFSLSPRLGTISELAFIRRSIRQGYCTTDLADITSFIDTTQITS